MGFAIWRSLLYISLRSKKQLLFGFLGLFLAFLAFLAFFGFNYCPPKKEGEEYQAIYQFLVL
jgi:hypothetical protein